MKHTNGWMIAVFLSAMPMSAVDGAATPDPASDSRRTSLRAIYKEMVEIDSSATTGSCSKVARAAEARLLAAGFAAEDVQFVTPEGKPESNYLIAVDSVGAGPNELVLVVSGSSARMAEGCKDKPVDASIVGIVDTVHLEK